MTQIHATDARHVGLAKALNQTFQVYLDTHIAHWNVRGPHFAALHAMFEEQYTELWDALDLIAERLRSLGQDVARNDVTGGPSFDGKDAMSTVATLAKQHRSLAAHFQALEESAVAANDSGTADMAIERLRAHEQHAWMLEAITE